MSISKTIGRKIAAILSCEQRLFYYIWTEIYYNINKSAMLGRKSRTETRQTKEITFCWSCPSATFASQRGGFVPRE